LRGDGLIGVVGALIAVVLHEQFKRKGGAG
jgi:hypothetical protein